MEKTLLMAESSRTDLNVNQNKNDVTRNDETTEDGNFPALRSNFRQQT